MGMGSSWVPAVSQVKLGVDSISEKSRQGELGHGGARRLSVRRSVGGTLKPPRVEEEGAWLEDALTLGAIENFDSDPETDEAVVRKIKVSHLLPPVPSALPASGLEDTSISQTADFAPSGSLASLRFAEDLDADEGAGGEGRQQEEVVSRLMMSSTLTPMHAPLA